MRNNTQKLIITLCFIFSMIFIENVSGQTQKGNWMIGGSGGFMSNNMKMTNFIFDNSITSSNTKTTNLYLNGNIGYFIKDRLVIGLSPNINLSSVKNTYTDIPSYNSTSKGSILGMGIYSRYYFLNNQEKYNFIGELSYGFDKITNEGRYLKNSSISIGPVLFLNRNTSLDFLLKYYNSDINYGNNKVSGNIISFNIGLQVYLQ